METDTLLNTPLSFTSNDSGQMSVDSAYAWGSVPSSNTTDSDWLSSPSSGQRNHGLSVQIPPNPNISIEPISSASPSQLFAAPTADAYESLYQGPDATWNAIIAAQSLYSSPSVDPFAQHNKHDPNGLGTGFLSGTDYVNVKSAYPALALPESTLAPPPADFFASLTTTSAFPTGQTTTALPKPANPVEPAPTTRAPARGNAKPAKTQTALANTTKRRRQPTDDVIAQRRKKHNEIEIRRRQRLNDNFQELQTLIQYERKEKDKDSVLRAAIDRILAYRKRAEDLEHALEQKQLTRLERPIPVLPPMSSFNSKVNHNVVFENNNVAMALANLRGKLLDANHRFCELLGYDIVKLREVPCVQLTHPDDVPTLFESLKLLLGGAVASFTATRRMLSANRRYVTFSNTIWLVKDSTGTPQYIMGLFVPTGVSEPINEDQVPKALPAPFTCKESRHDHDCGNPNCTE